VSQINEVQFTANVKSWIDAICRELATVDQSFPFLGAEIEERKEIGRKRRDLVLRPRQNPLGHALTGEIKLPDRPDGRTPYSEMVVLDAHSKASAVGAEYFFTWNVNRFVLWQTFRRDSPIFDRSITFYDWFPEGQEVHRSDDLLREDVQQKLKRRLEEFLVEYAEIYKGAKPFPRRPLDEWFIHLLECALDRPTFCTLAEILKYYSRDVAFHGNLDQWMIRNLGATITEEESQDNLERAARYSCYVLTNRIVFYDALRRKYPKRLESLSVPKRTKTGADLRGHLEDAFRDAERVSEDYETVFRGDSFGDRLPFLSDLAIEGWRGLIEQVDKYDFTALDYGIIGQIFEGLLSPRERHRYGQHYTKSEIVDLINAFVIRSSRDRVLDPACGGGTFLIRAYARKKWLAEREQKIVSHESLLSDIYGVDLSRYAVHLSTISLTTRDLVRASNYPRVACSDFFDVALDKVMFPAGISQEGDRFDFVPLPKVDAVIGNPPYIRQERLSQEQKKAYHEKCETAWKGIDLSGRSDIHVYFWPHAASFLKESGYFGFLTSSMWLDVEYGFPLQRWALENFAIIAIMESSVEPWFTDARIGTAVTILRREPDVQKRLNNLVRFVEIRRPLSDILADYERAGDRIEAAERIQRFLESLTENVENENWRIRVVRQENLISDLELSENEENEEEDAEEEDVDTKNARNEMKNCGDPTQRHTGGKWGIHLRAPDVFFKLVDRCSERLVPLGRIADVRRGVTTGCDAFFYPRDVTDTRLREMSEEQLRLAFGLTPKETRKVRVCKAGDGSPHLIEAQFLEPIIHSVFELTSGKVDKKRLARQILLVNLPKSGLHKKHEHVWKYIVYGETYALGTRDPRPVHEKSTVAARTRKKKRWYDLTDSIRPAICWPKAHQYKHIVARNEERLICNCRLYGIDPIDQENADLLWAVLLSTPVALMKFLFGRMTGREGNLDTMVCDAKMMLVPDTRVIDRRLRKEIVKAAYDLCRKPSEDLLRDMETPERLALDKTVLRSLGVAQFAEQDSLLTAIYDQLRTRLLGTRNLELIAQRNRLRAARRGRTTPMSIAAEIWESLEAKEQGDLRPFPSSFLPSTDSGGTEVLDLPEGHATMAQMFGSFSVNIGGKSFAVGSEVRAKLLIALANEGIFGPVAFPESDTACRRALRDWQGFRDMLHDEFQNLAAQRTADPQLIVKIIADLWRRYWRWSAKQD